jgi:hypothetical protein
MAGGIGALLLKILKSFFAGLGTCDGQPRWPVQHGCTVLVPVTEGEVGNGAQSPIAIPCRLGIVPQPP